MKTKKTGTETTSVVIKRRTNNFGASLPVLKKEVVFLLNNEDAKVSSSKILSAAVALISLGVMSQKVAADYHNSSLLHSNAHGSRYMGNFHANIGTPVHSDAAACHMNTGAGHASNSPHVNASPAPHGNAGAPHHSRAPSSGAINAHASTNSAVTEGLFHNNASRGAHTAQLGHNNLLATHINRPADHVNAAPHVNAGSTTISKIGGHTNTSSPHSSSPHCSMTGHFSALPVVNIHTNAHNSTFTGHANDHGQHGSHNSHGQW